MKGNGRRRRKPMRTRIEVLEYRDKLKFDKRQVADTVRKVCEWFLQIRERPPDL